MSVLPVEHVDGRFRLHEGTARQVGASLHAQYADANPFPHICLDAFLPKSLAGRLLSEFPNEASPDDITHDKGYSGLHKRTIHPKDASTYTEHFFQFLNSKPVLSFLEEMTGIRGLIADPDFSGGGLHETSRGGLLGVHVDFRLHERLRLQRRLNMIVYLNPSWDPDWGGQLGLWDQKVEREVRLIAPLFNRCVVFNTDARSFHGHPDPLSCPPSVRRRSVAMYYYTASDLIFSEIPANSTIYVPRAQDDGEARARAFRVRMYSLLKDVIPPFAFRALRRISGGREFNR